MSLPLIVDLAVSEAVPKELIEAAERARATLSDGPERVVRRQVRDALDAERVRLGLIGSGGLARMEARIAAGLAGTIDPAYD